MAIIKQYCNKKIVDDIQYEFWYSTSVDGSTYLDKVKKYSKTESLEIFYHPRTGKPLTVYDLISHTKIQYDPEGRLLIKKSPKEKLFFTYGSLGKVESVRILDRIKNQSRSFFYSYNKKGLISTVSTESGPTIQIEYDQLQRVSSLLDSQSSLFFSYQTGKRKPSTVSANNIFSINKKQFTNQHSSSSDGKTLVEKFLQLTEPVRSAKKLKNCITKDIWIHQEGGAKCVI